MNEKMKQNLPIIIIGVIAVIVIVIVSVIILGKKPDIQNTTTEAITTETMTEESSTQVVAPSGSADATVERVEGDESSDDSTNGRGSDILGNDVQIENTESETSENGNNAVYAPEGNDDRPFYRDEDGDGIDDRFQGNPGSL